MKKKIIFTFWEPTNKMPGYLKLCIDTWKKILGKDYKIVVLNYANLDLYINEKFPKILFDKFALMNQADAIRVAVLKKYGGIWLDADTLIVNKNFKKCCENDSNLTLIGKHIGFISAKQNSHILEVWEKEVRSRLSYCESVGSIRRALKHAHRWDYLGNAIIDKYLDKADSKEFKMLDQSTLSFPENNNHRKSFRSNYRNFYFKLPIDEKSINNIINNNPYGFIYLHNNWTPKKFKRMSKQEFMNTKTTLAAIIDKILSKKEN